MVAFIRQYDKFDQNNNNFSKIFFSVCIWKNTTNNFFPFSQSPVSRYQKPGIPLPHLKHNQINGTFKNPRLKITTHWLPNSFTTGISPNSVYPRRSSCTMPHCSYRNRSTHLIFFPLFVADFSNARARTLITRVRKFALFDIHRVFELNPRAKKRRCLPTGYTQSDERSRNFSPVTSFHYARGDHPGYKVFWKMKGYFGWCVLNRRGGLCFIRSPGMGRYM